VSEERVRGGVERRTLFITTDMRVSMIGPIWLSSCESAGSAGMHRVNWNSTMRGISWLVSGAGARARAVARAHSPVLESGVHKVLDTAFAEDAHPWIRNDDQGR